MPILDSEYPSVEGVLPSAECARDPVLDERALYQRATKVLLGTSGCVLKVPKEPKNQDERASISAQGKWVQPVRELHDTTQKALDWALEAVRRLALCAGTGRERVCG